MHTPEEAVSELEYAVTVLGFKAVLCAGYVQRPFAALADKDPEVSRYAFWLDQFGLDSAYDYDPVWAKAQELGVSLAFHSGFIGMTPYRSPPATCSTTCRCWPKASSRWPSRCSSAASPGASRG